MLGTFSVERHEFIISFFAFLHPVFDLLESADIHIFVEERLGYFFFFELKSSNIPQSDHESLF